MKRFFYILALLSMTAIATAQNTKVTQGTNVDLPKYKYAYVMQTSGVTSGGGPSMIVLRKFILENPIKTINPAEMISGHMMKMGFRILPSVNPNFEDKTLIVSYGYVENEFSSSIVMIQMRDAKTQNLAISFETEGDGLDDSDDIQDAIQQSMKMFQYYYAPAIHGYLSEVYKTRIFMALVNETPNVVNHVTLRVTYYTPEDEFVHEQTVHIDKTIYSSQSKNITIKRDKEAQNKKLKFKMDVVDYN